MQVLANGNVLRIEYRDFDNNEYNYLDILRDDIFRARLPLAKNLYIENVGYIEIPNIEIKESNNRSIEKCFYMKTDDNSKILWISVDRNIIMNGKEEKMNFFFEFAYDTFLNEQEQQKQLKEMEIEKICNRYRLEHWNGNFLRFLD